MVSRSNRAAALVAVTILITMALPTAAHAAVECFGEPATEVGTARDDDIIGTPGRDVIAGVGGDDEIEGRGGNDLLCGGDGDDRLLGGEDADRLSGGDNYDVMYGGDGPRLRGPAPAAAAPMEDSATIAVWHSSERRPERRRRQRPPRGWRGA